MCCKNGGGKSEADERCWTGTSGEGGCVLYMTLAERTFARQFILVYSSQRRYSGLFLGWVKRALSFFNLRCLRIRIDGAIFARRETAAVLASFSFFVDACYGCRSYSSSCPRTSLQRFDKVYSSIKSERKIGGVARPSLDPMRARWNTKLITCAQDVT